MVIPEREPTTHTEIIDLIIHCNMKNKEYLIYVVFVFVLAALDALVRSSTVLPPHALLHHGDKREKEHRSFFPSLLPLLFSRFLECSIVVDLD